MSKRQFYLHTTGLGFAPKVTSKAIYYAQTVGSALLLMATVASLWFLAYIAYYIQIS